MSHGLRGAALATACASALLFAGEGPSARSKEADPAPAPPAYVEADVVGGGFLTGVVRGPAPSIAPSDTIVTKDKSTCGERMPSEAIFRAEDGALKNVVVFLQEISKGKPINRSRPRKIDNHACRYEPHVLAVAVGQRIEISNSDPILHSTHAWDDGTRTVFSVALPVQNQRITKPVKSAGLFSVKCDSGHSWMLAYIYAFDHPYFAVTDEKGSFRIDQIPPGKYKVTAWHELLGTETQELTVGGGQESKLTFEHLAR